MAATPPTWTHLQDHNGLSGDVVSECARFGITPTTGGPYNAGDPYHIAEHGKMVSDLQSIATAAGRTYTTPLPKTPKLGDVGHIQDHLDLRACVDEAAQWPAFNDATGGTITEVDNYNGTGTRFRVHTFTSSGTLNVSRALQPFRVLVIGGGGSGRYNPPGWSGGGGKAGGEFTRSIAAGTYPVTVGAGSPTDSSGTGGGGGGTSSFLDITSAGGNRGGDNNNGGGGWHTHSDISGGQVLYGANPGRYAYTAYGPGSGGGGGAATNNWGLGGSGGQVIVAYQIG